MAGTLLDAMGKARKCKCFMRIHVRNVLLITPVEFSKQNLVGYKSGTYHLFSEHTYTRLSVCTIPDSPDHLFLIVYAHQATFTQSPWSQSRSLKLSLSLIPHTDHMDPDIELTEKRGPAEALLPLELPGEMRLHNLDQQKKMVEATKFTVLSLFLPHLPPVPTP